MVKSALLDTQILIWLAQSPNSISNEAYATIYSDTKLMFSYASIWEMAIKVKTRKLQLGHGLNNFIETAIFKHDVELLPISLSHFYQTQQLELHHRDPFDRLLAAQSIVEKMPVISFDEIFDQYPVERIWK